jgi:hypothetical protein
MQSAYPSSSSLKHDVFEPKLLQQIAALDRPDDLVRQP